MSRLFSTEEICERALRKVGAFAIRSAGARPEEVTETRYWLDMVVAHEASRQRTWWLVPAAASFNLTAGIDTYDLNAMLGAAQAPDGIQFAIGAVLFNPTLQLDLHELPIVRQQEWETRRLGPDGTPDPENLSALLEEDAPPSPADPPGAPAFCHIDRAQRPTLRCYPIPDANQPYAIRLLFQSFSSDFIKAPTGDKSYQLRTSMNLWIVTALARQIGNGPVRKLPADEVRDMADETERLRNDLEAYEFNEVNNVPKQVKYYDF